MSATRHAQLGTTAMLEPVTHVLMVFAGWQPGLGHVVCVLTNHLVCDHVLGRPTENAVLVTLIGQLSTAAPAPTVQGICRCMRLTDQQ